MLNEKTLAVITDDPAAEFARNARKGVDLTVRARGWRSEWVGAGKMSMAMRLAMLRQMFTSGRYHAALYTHLGLTPEEVHLFQQWHVPLGYMGGKPVGAHWVVADEAHGAWEAAQHLLKKGHRNIALVNGPQEFEECRQRESGFRKAMAEAGVVPDENLLVYLSDFSKDSGMEAGLILFSLPRRPTAVFVAAGDLAARGLMQAAHERGLKIPHYVSIMGYDDLSFADSLIPPLSTVRQPLKEMAQVLSDSLISHCENPGTQPLHEHLKPELVLRESVSAPPA